MANQQIIPLNIEKSIDTSAVERDIQQWEAQDLVLVNTGICREGGVTNLGAKVGSDQAFEETFYCSNGSKVQLLRDTLNKCFHVYGDSRELGIVPLWGVKSRGIISGNVADVMATISGTLLFLYYSQGLATIEEVDAGTFARINVKTITLPLGLSQICFCRTKQPTFSNVSSVAAYSVVSTSTTKTITAYIYNAAGLVFTDTITTVPGSEPINILAHYEHGWIVEIDIWNNHLTTNNLWMVKTDGSATKLLGQVNTKGLIADYNIGAGSITYKTMVDKMVSFPATAFISTGGTTGTWTGICSDLAGNLWATISPTGDIYKCLAGTTAFIAIGGTLRSWSSICCDPSGNIWATTSVGDIYKCTNPNSASPTFTAIGGTSRAWAGICADFTGNLWATESGGYIYKCVNPSAGSPTFTSLGGSTNGWLGIGADPSGNIWAIDSSNIWKCLYGSTTFASVASVGGANRGICSDPAGNIWLSVGGGDIYKALSGTVTFTGVGGVSRNWRGITSDPAGTIWVTVDSGPIYYYVSGNSVYSITITPPSADGGAWTPTSNTDFSLITASTKQRLTFGGLAVNQNNYSYFYNLKTSRGWQTYQADLPEIYGNLWPSLTDFALKIHTVGGLGAYLSASFNIDGIGSPITEIGELSPYYAPHAIQVSASEYLVLYQRGDGTFASVSISSAVYDRMQEIKSGVVKINCVSGLNVADTTTADLKMGGNAFNGFAIVGFASAALMGAWAARHRGAYGGSVDTGYKNNTATAAGTVVFVIIPEAVQYSYNNELIDIFVGLPPSSLNYYQSIISGAGVAQNPALLGTIYVDDQILPIPSGAQIAERSAKLVKSTALREIDYDGYQLGNEVQGDFDSFALYGNVYFIDSEWIHGISVSASNVIASAPKLVPVQGLRYITASPKEAYLVSDFDNALFVFNGGQSVEKQALFNRREIIVDGVFSVIENTLALLSDATVIFIRDGIISETPVPFASSPRPFATVDGIWLSRDGYSISYTFKPTSVATPIAGTISGGTWGTVYADTLSGGTWGASYDIISGGVWSSDAITPLQWQSKFCGFSDREIQSIDRFLIRIYKEDMAEARVTVTYEYFTEEVQNIYTRDYTIGDVDHPYDSQGYAYFEYVPPDKRSVGASIGITSNDKIVLLSIIATMSSEGKTSVSNR